jgi:hypothetical protein
LNVELAISILALIVSIATVWITVFHRGTIKMSRPQFFALIPEDGPFGSWIKFFMRVLLFSTGQRGRVIESMYVTLNQNGNSLPFHYWMYGDTDRLAIGSGVFVGHEGLAANHHFVPVGTVSSNDIVAGTYHAEVHANLLGDRTPTRLFDLKFVLSEDEVSALRTSKDKAIFFTWDKSERVYKSRIDVRKPKGRSFSVSGSGHGPFSWE